MPPATVYLVGAGPGDPGLLTIRARELLERADAVVYDALVAPEILRHARPEAERLDFGKRGGAGTPAGEVQAEIERRLIELARAGKTVVRLKGGDPYVFGRGGEEALALAAAGVPFEVVPGVTAGIAAAACAGIPATHRGLASSLILVTGHEDPGKPESALDWPALAAASASGTLVVYMGMQNLPELAARLLAHRPATTPAAVVEWGTTGRQRTVVSTLAGIAEAARAAGLGAPAVLVLGAVVALREKLRWFDTPERRPLFGRRVLVTRARETAGELTRRLSALGADCLELAAIHYAPPADPEPLRRAARDCAKYDWLLFTSARGVEAFGVALAVEKRDARALGGVKLGAVGPGTAGALAALGLRADFVPRRALVAALGEELAAAEPLAGKRILLPRAEEANPALAATLAAAGAEVTEVVAYRTLPAEPLPAAERGKLFAARLEFVTLASASTVRGLAAALGGADGLRRLVAGGARLASLGPQTSAAARELGLEVAVEAADSTLDGLIAAVVGAARTVGPQKAP